MISNTVVNFYIASKHTTQEKSIDTTTACNTLWSHNNARPERIDWSFLPMPNRDKHSRADRPPVRATTVSIRIKILFKNKASKTMRTSANLLGSIR